MQRFPQARTFYDTDGDGTIDLVLLDRDRDGQADEQLKLVKGHWVRSVPKKQPMIDAKLFQDPGMRQRFVQLVK
jgi:hypothetical protein